MKQIIHVNTNTIKSNRKNNEWNPAIIIRNGKKRQYGFEVVIRDESGAVVGRFIQDNVGLDCGAKVWWEQESGTAEVVT